MTKFQILTLWFFHQIWVKNFTKCKSQNWSKLGQSQKLRKSISGNGLYALESYPTFSFPYNILWPLILPTLSIFGKHLYIFPYSINQVIIKMEGFQTRIRHGLNGSTLFDKFKTRCNRRMMRRMMHHPSLQTGRFWVFLYNQHLVHLGNSPLEHTFWVFIVVIIYISNLYIISKSVQICSEGNICVILSLQICVQLH